MHSTPIATPVVRALIETETQNTLTSYDHPTHKQLEESWESCVHLAPHDEVFLMEVRGRLLQQRDREGFVEFKETSFARQLGASPRFHDAEIQRNRRAGAESFFSTGR